MRRLLLCLLAIAGLPAPAAAQSSISCRFPILNEVEIRFSENAGTVSAQMGRKTFTYVRKGEVYEADHNAMPPLRISADRTSAVMLHGDTREVTASARCRPLDDAATARTDDWVGRWGAPGCGADGTVIVLTRKQLDLSAFEATCRVTGVARSRGRYELRARCTGEGRPVNVSFTVRADRDSLTFVSQKGMEFTPKRFRRCG